jgi:hypothetical protein
VAVVKAVMRMFSYLFHALLALFLLAISGLALVSGSHNLRLEMLPWTGSTLTYWLFFGGLFGLFTVLLAINGMLKVLFLLWALGVLVLLLRGYFLGPFHFSGSDEFKDSVYLMTGAFLAFLGAWFQFRRRLVRR